MQFPFWLNLASGLLILPLCSKLARAQYLSRDQAEICRRYQDVPLPSESQAVEHPSTYPTCEAYKDYAGIGRRVDYAAARQCAWQEREAQLANLSQTPQAPTSWMIGGDAILVNLYVNGLSVPRNLPLAMRLACEKQSGLAADAIQNIDKLQQAGTAGEPVPPGQVQRQIGKRFDVCDSAASTLTQNFCADYSFQISEAQRHRELSRLSSAWTPDQKIAFAQLQKAEEIYVKEHPRELDQAGSIHGMRDLASENILRQNFLLDLRQFEKGHTPTGTKAAADEEENQMRKQLQQNLEAARVPAPPAEDGTAVKESNIQQVQACWEQYRDAWIAFARVRYPNVPADSFDAYFSRQRLELLREMRKQIDRS